MNCANWEERIALYMGDDLSPVDRAEVERHLCDCAGCQVFASGIRESLDLLREAHAGELNEAAFAAVRARVLGELENRRRPFWRRAWVYGLACAALLLALFWTRPASVNRHTVAHVEQTAPKQLPIPQPAIAPEPPAPRIVRVHRHTRRLKPAFTGPPRVAAAPEKSLVVKMVTDDPDVVIYWITDTRGEI